MSSYAVVEGDATEPKGTGVKVICHCVNDVGHWGAGFVSCLGKWPWVESAYRRWAALKWSPREVLRLAIPDIEDGVGFELGRVQFVQIQPDLWVANLVGQHRTITMGEAKPIRYEALEMGLRSVAAFCSVHQASVHAPRLGAGLARGKWSRIVELLDAELVDRGVSVTIYDLQRPK